MIEHIETARMAMRALALDDVDILVKLDGDPAVMRYINGGKSTSRIAMEEIVRQQRGHRWLAFHQSSGEFIGWFGIPFSDKGTHDRELGYRLRRSHWGKGLATEGARALIAVAFRDLGAHRVWAQTMTVNTASRRVMEHCGLRYVRLFHLEWPEAIDGTEFGDVEYEILKTDWEAAG
ncbi:MAG: GNAT family N-acetyltransferase [Candidatus Dormibacteria bacterium]